MNVKLQSSEMSKYMHTYEAYRISKGTTVKDAANKDVVLSDKEDTLVLTSRSAKQLVADRMKYGDLLYSRLQEACYKTQDEALKKQTKDQVKVMSVFRNMSKGNTVPSGDEMKLMDYDPKMYQLAKMAQLIAQLAAERERKKENSEWDDKEEEEFRAKMDELNANVDEALDNIGIGSSAFREAQKGNIVEVDASNVDLSSMKTINLGGVVGEFIDLSM